jgi:hypothetical protein
VKTRLREEEMIITDLSKVLLKEPLLKGIRRKANSLLRTLDWCNKVFPILTGIIIPLLISGR